MLQNKTRETRSRPSIAALSYKITPSFSTKNSRKPNRTLTGNGLTSGSTNGKQASPGSRTASRVPADVQKGHGLEHSGVSSQTRNGRGQTCQLLCCCHLWFLFCFARQRSGEGLEGNIFIYLVGRLPEICVAFHGIRVWTLGTTHRSGQKKRNFRLCPKVTKSESQQAEGELKDSGATRTWLELTRPHASC